MMLILYIVIIISIAFTINTLYKRTNSFLNRFADTYKFKQIPSEAKFDLVNLGSTQPKFAFDYGDSGFNCMNWAIGPQTFEYDLAILKKYSKHLHDGSIVLIPVCPLSFFSITRTHPANVVKYYDLLNNDEVYDFNRWQKIREYIFPLFFHPQRLLRIFRDIKEDNYMSLQSNPMSYEQIIIDAVRWIDECWNKEFGIDIKNMKSLSKENTYAIEQNIISLRMIVDYCINNNFEPVISLLPVTKTLRKEFPVTFIQEYLIKYIEQSINGKSRILNFMDDENFQKDELFINSFLMNRKGAKIFTSHIIERLL